MNAGRDVERLIAGWLSEEAAARAPDRVLARARQSIDSTKQRRLVAAWEGPMYLTPLRLAGLAAVVAVAVAGAAWLGRATAPTPDVGAQQSPAPTASPTAPAATLESYRAARNAICAKYLAETEQFNTQLEGVYDPGLSPTERAAKVAVMRQIIETGQAMTRELEALAVPDALVADHAANMANYHDMSNLVSHEVDVLAAGNPLAAESIDGATAPIADAIQQFERRYNLDACP